MLKEKIRVYCERGESCSRIMLRAAAEEYGFTLSEAILAACSGITGGFGINGICSGLVAAVMVLGLLFEEDDVKIKRMIFLLKVQERLGALDCCRLSAKGENCMEVLEEIAEILQEVIEEKD